MYHIIPSAYQAHSLQTDRTGRSFKYQIREEFHRPSSLVRKTGLTESLNTKSGKNSTVPVLLLEMCPFSQNLMTVNTEFRDSDEEPPLSFLLLQ
jgi:hypothetical protein